LHSPKKIIKINRQWLGNKKSPTLREKLQQTIEAVLTEKPVDFNAFLKLMELSGYGVKHGKHISFKGKSGKRFIRLSSLKDNYTEDSIREIIEGERIYKPKEKLVSQQPINNLLVQIQRCVVPKGSPGYYRWAAVFNLKQLSRTFNFWQDNNLLEYEKLAKKARKAKDDFNSISSRIKAIDSRLPEISSLQKNIGTYSKTKDVYTEYRKSKWSKKYYFEHKDDIELHKAVKKAFDDLGLEKLPTIKALQTEYATLLSEKKSLYSKYKDARNYMQEILAVKQNSEQLLGYAESAKAKENERI